MLFDFAAVLVFIALAVLCVFFTLVFSWVVRPSKPSSEKASTYECGEIPAGNSWIKFNIHFYVIALIFIIFEVEILVLFPWAVVFQKLGMTGFIEMLVFVGILTLGLAYLWKKGDLDWVKDTNYLKDEDKKD
ncbi:MAG: NADH-quinone oxidoreductase subunit A [Planctomycetes bacterium]|nr:NADH-quinone oxidoreductase subunit A [Planctomycetota bacterium]